MLTDAFLERLSWFDKSYLQHSNDEVYVWEKADDGKAQLRCQLSGPAVAIHLNQNPLRCLNNRRCADALILAQDADGRWVLHVIECKKTLTPGQLDGIKKQFEGAILNALAIGGVLGLPAFFRICCYVACREDRLDTAPARLKLPLGRPPDDTSMLEFRNRRLNLLSLRDVPYQRIALDLEGNGEHRF